MYCEALARLQQGCNEASGTFRENLKKTGRVIEVITRSQAALQFVTVNQAIVLDTVPRFLEEFMDLRKVNVEEITASISRELGRKRRVAKYSGETVLLDPKTYGENPEDKSGNKIYERVKDLARELNNISPDEWQTLRCRGWFEDTQKEQFYFVYETPAYCEAPTKYKTLYQYVDSSFMPSVSDRIQLALTLARAMHRIHKKGWLHKGFRSDHVLFFPKKSRASRSIEDPRLVGFDFARRDHPGEYSEEVMSTNANLYRHPKALRDRNIGFTKLHDYYSFGIVLVEIALWQTIGEILRPEECKESDTREVRDILLDDDSQENHPRHIAFRMGNIYRDMVKVCLMGDFGVIQDPLSAFEERVVKALGQIVI